MFQRFLIQTFLACARRPVVTLGVLLALMLGSLGSLRYLKFSDLYESFFAGTSEDWTFYNELTHAFVTDQIIAVGLEPPSELYTAENLAVVRALSRKLEAVPHVESVNDVSQAKYFKEGTDSFSSEPLLPDPIPTDPEALQRIKARALSEPLFVGGIVSQDGKMAAVHVRVEADVTPETRSELVTEVQRIVEETRAAQPGWRIALTGNPWFTYYHEVYMVRDLAVLTPLTMVLLLVMMFVVMRRVAGPVLGLIGSFLFVVVSTALLVWTGGTMNNTTTMIPPFAFIMGVTVVMHFFTEYRLNFLRRKDRGVALTHTIEELSAPVYYANFSTALGFLSLAISNIPAMRQFGLAMAIGMVVIVFVLMAYCAAVGRLVSPERLSRVEPAQEEKNLTSVRLLEGLGAHIFAHRGLWLTVVALSSVVTLYGATQIEIETNTLEMFHERDPLYQDAKYYGSRFGGVSSVYIALEGDGPDVLTHPETLKQVEDLEQFVRRELKAGYTVSPASFIKTMHRAFFDGDAAHQVVPDSQAAVAQLLLINTDEDLKYVLNSDRSRGVLVAWIDEHSSGKLLAMKKRLNAYLEQLPARGVKYRLSGTVMLDTQLIDDVSRSTFQSFMIAMGVIFLLRLVQFRHLGLGALSLLPNAFPIWTTFGFMGLTGIALNVSTAMSATVTLGIADDETIHFFASYRAKRERGIEPRQAVLETLTDKGSGILFSTIVIILGFSTLLFSNYGPTMWFGVVLVISFIFSLFANLVFGPALLDLVRPMRTPVAPAAAPEVPPAPPGTPSAP